MYHPEHRFTNAGGFLITTVVGLAGEMDKVLCSDNINILYLSWYNSKTVLGCFKNLRQKRSNP